MTFQFSLASGPKTESGLPPPLGWLTTLNFSTARILRRLHHWIQTWATRDGVSLKKYFHCGVRPLRRACNRAIPPAGARGWNRTACVSTLGFRRIEPDVQLAQLLRRHRRRRAHEQILGALVHRKKHDLAQIVLAREQHDDAVEAGRDPAVRRRAILESAIHAAEFFEQRILAIAGECEGLRHDVRPMVSYRAGGKLDAVADDVILNGLDAENRFFVSRIELEKSLGIEIRHRKRIMRKVNFLLLLVPFVHWKIDDPAEFKDGLFGEAELTADTKPRGTSEFGGVVFLVASEKHRVAGFQSGLLCDLPLRPGGKKFGDRAFAGKL